MPHCPLSSFFISRRQVNNENVRFLQGPGYGGEVVVGGVLISEVIRASYL